MTNFFKSELFDAIDFPNRTKNQELEIQNKILSNIPWSKNNQGILDNIAKCYPWVSWKYLLKKKTEGRDIFWSFLPESEINTIPIYIREDYRLWLGYKGLKKFPNYGFWKYILWQFESNWADERDDFYKKMAVTESFDSFFLIQVTSELNYYKHNLDDIHGYCRIAFNQDTEDLNDLWDDYIKNREAYDLKIRKFKQIEEMDDLLSESFCYVRERIEGPTEN